MMLSFGNTSFTANSTEIVLQRPGRHVDSLMFLTTNDLVSGTAFARTLVSAFLLESAHSAMPLWCDAEMLGSLPRCAVPSRGMSNASMNFVC